MLTATLLRREPPNAALRFAALCARGAADIAHYFLLLPADDGFDIFGRLPFRFYRGAPELATSLAGGMKLEAAPIFADGMIAASNCCLPLTYRRYFEYSSAARCYAGARCLYWLSAISRPKARRHGIFFARMTFIFFRPDIDISLLPYASIGIKYGPGIGFISLHIYARRSMCQP